jgi:hypothetical protein
MHNGETIVGHADFPKGHPQNPMSYAEVAQKFLANLGDPSGIKHGGGLPRERALQLIELVEGLERLKDLSVLTDALIW